MRLVWLYDDSEKTSGRRTWRWPSLVRALESEPDRWALWLPVMVGLGIAAYFSAPVEPPLWASWLAAGGAFLAWRLWRHGTLGPALMATLAAAAFGFAVAALRTHSVAAPALAIPLKAVEIVGRLEAVEPRPQRGQRLTIAVETLANWPADRTPARVRVSLMKPATDLRVGQRISLRADLSPPTRPVIPGGYDFARAAYFDRIGGIGFSFQAPAVLKAEASDATSADIWRDMREAVGQARAEIARRIRAALPGQTGAVASALITGERGPISEATETAFRDSGLAHLLVISGLHMAIVTGAAFLFLRSGLSLVPAIALRFATKKWAAVIAALLATAYLLISGGAVATVRAYIMVLVMLVAVLLDRPAIALRNVAIAALLILIFRPESLLSAGFQMSFAAVVALVAAYEFIRDRARPGTRAFDRGRLRRMALWVGGIGLTTVIASAAVAPIAAYHFQRSQQYALLANIVAGPVMNLWVMPLALLSMIALPFGLEAWPLWLMGLGIDFTSQVAAWIAGLPGAMILVPAMPWAAFVAIACGGIWLVIWRRRWRLWGVVVIAAGLAAAPLRSAPDVLVGREAAIVAVRKDNGSLSLIGARGRWVGERWLVHDGDSRSVREVLRAGRSACDGDSCSTLAAGNVRVTLTRHPRAFNDDCANADILIVAFRRPAPCPSAKLVIDARRIQSHGAHRVVFASDADGRLGATFVGFANRTWASFQRPAPSEANTTANQQIGSAVEANAPTPSSAGFRVTAVDDLRGKRPWVVGLDQRERQWQLLRQSRPTKSVNPQPSTGE